MPSLPESPVTVVTGANSGIGRATAVHLASRGHRVFGTVRRLDSAAKLEQMAAAAGTTVELVQVDVADDSSVARGFAEIHDKAGPVDVLVNNAGLGANSVVEDVNAAQMIDVFNVNVCGGIRCAQQVLPSMRERRSGCIVNVTSVSGLVAGLAQAPYIASKWAFEGISEELAQEVAAFGIRVAIIEPGVTKSAIFAKNVDIPAGTGAYPDAYERLFQLFATGIPVATDPMEVAQVIEEAITTDTPRLRWLCSWGGPELAAGRAAVSDEEWVALAAAPADAYYDGFQQVTGLDIRPVQ